MRTKFKPWAEPYINSHKEVMFALQDSETLMNIELEIGCGKGIFLTKMSQMNPNKFFLGIEKNVTCCGFCAKKLVEEEITNAKLYFGDAYEVLNLLPENSVNTLYLNFSDPWPKSRHHKRRLTSDRILPLYRKILSKNGVIIMKTDNRDLFDYSISKFLEAKFKIVERTDNYIFDKNNDVMTEYEEDFRKEGVKINRMVVKDE